MTVRIIKTQGVSEKDMKKVIKEVQMLSILGHESFPKFHDTFKDDKNFYIVTEYKAAGLTVSDIIRLSEKTGDIDEG